MTEYLLAHDLGTSGDKATLFSTEGKLVYSTVSVYETYYSHHNWVEQNAEDWWRAVCEATRELLTKSGIDAGSIGAVSFSGQMMGCLCVDRKGMPLRPAIIWADQRAQEQVKIIEERVSQREYYKIVGHRNTASYGIQKLMWVQRHEPEIYEQTYKMLNAKDYMVLKLTGKFCTDYSDGNSCGFFDLKKLSWSEELLSCSGIDMDKLPELYPSTHMAGGVTPEAARATGLAEGTPVIIGAGDGVATNVGAGSIAPGKSFCSIGTSAWITTTSEKPFLDDGMQIVTWAHMVPGLYAPNGTMQYAGGAYSWLKRTFFEKSSKISGEESTYDVMDQEAQKSSAGANGVIFLPYMLGERSPRWDPYAKGCFLGLKPENTRGDIIRSVLEGVTLNLSIILDIMRRYTDIEELTILGGGAKGKTWRKIMADIFQADLFIPQLLDEAGSMGAAVNAGVGTGIYKDYSAIDSFLHIREVQRHDPGAASAYHTVKILYEQSYHALRDFFHFFELKTPN